MRGTLRSVLFVESPWRSGTHGGSTTKIVGEEWQVATMTNSNGLRLRDAKPGTVGYVLVFPAASRPSIKSLISFDPKILSIILVIELPMFVACTFAARV